MHVSGGNTVIENLVPRTRYGHLKPITGVETAIKGRYWTKRIGIFTTTPGKNFKCKW